LQLPIRIYYFLDRVILVKADSHPLWTAPCHPPFDLYESTSAHTLFDGLTFHKETHPDFGTDRENLVGVTQNATRADIAGKKMKYVFSAHSRDLKLHRNRGCVPCLLAALYRLHTALYHVLAVFFHGCYRIELDSGEGQQASCHAKKNLNKPRLPQAVEKHNWTKVLI